MSGDLLLHEGDNEDQLYIMRLDFDGYEVGKDSPNAPKPACPRACRCFGIEHEGVRFLR